MDIQTHILSQYEREIKPVSLCVRLWHFTLALICCETETKRRLRDSVDILLLYLYMPKIILNIQSVEIWKISTKQLPQLPSTYVDIRIEYVL